MQENEMKFLVKNKDFLLEERISTKHIKQGYLSTDKERVVRVRLLSEDHKTKGVLTVKGKSEIVNGFDSRYEFETEIPPEDCIDMFSLCTKTIDKTRFTVRTKNNLVLEVDVFADRDIQIVEFELPDAIPFNQDLLPDWVGKNVTGDKNFYNSNMR